MKKKKTELKYIEYDIVGHCNLNCKGCSHFSNLQKEEEYVAIESYEKDMRRLAELFSTVNRIKLLGGEPLLHPQLKEIIEVTREIFPETRIDLVTNGLLLPTLEESIVKTIKDCRVTVIITMYPTTEKMKNNILEKVSKDQLQYSFYEEKESFRRQLTKQKKHRKIASHFACGIKGCTGIHNGYLGKCPMSIHMNRFNHAFSTNFPEKEGINIHDPKVTAKKILTFIEKPIDLCAYCSTKHEFFEWKPVGMEQEKEEDWYSIYNEGNAKDSVKAYITQTNEKIKRKRTKAWKQIKKPVKRVIKKVRNKVNSSNK